jgi:hypothetical protein
MHACRHSYLPGWRSSRRSGTWPSNRPTAARFARSCTVPWPCGPRPVPAAPPWWRPASSFRRTVPAPDRCGPFAESQRRCACWTTIRGAALAAFVPSARRSFGDPSGAATPPRTPGPAGGRAATSGRKISPSPSGTTRGNCTAPRRRSGSCPIPWAGSRACCETGTFPSFRPGTGASRTRRWQGSTSTAPRLGPGRRARPGTRSSWIRWDAGAPGSDGAAVEASLLLRLLPVLLFRLAGSLLSTARLLLLWPPLSSSGQRRPGDHESLPEAPPQMPMPTPARRSKELATTMEDVQEAAAAARPSNPHRPCGEPASSSSSQPCCSLTNYLPLRETQRPGASRPCSWSSWRTGWPAERRWRLKTITMPGPPPTTSKTVGLSRGEPK